MIIITPKTIQEEFNKQFEYVNFLIERHRISAFSVINTEILLANWEVGQYVSIQLKTSRWGAKVVSELADYLKRQNPKRRGFGKRNIYNMVKFYEIYSEMDFTELAESLNLKEIVQLPTAQTENESVRYITEKNNISEEMSEMPAILTITTFTNHVEILNRCHCNEERLFYMLYAHNIMEN